MLTWHALQRDRPKGLSDQHLWIPPHRGLRSVPHVSLHLKSLIPDRPPSPRLAGIFTATPWPRLCTEACYSSRLGKLYIRGHQKAPPVPVDQGTYRIRCGKLRGRRGRRCALGYTSCRSEDGSHAGTVQPPRLQHKSQRCAHHARADAASAAPPQAMGIQPSPSAAACAAARCSGTLHRRASIRCVAWRNSHDAARPSDCLLQCTDGPAHLHTVPHSWQTSIMSVLVQAPQRPSRPSKWE